MGCSTLYHLAHLGARDAILLERHCLTSGTTWHSAAQVRALRSTYNLTALVRHSIALYDRLEEETGQSVGWINAGSLSLACNEGRLTHIKRQEALAKRFGMSAQSIGVGEAKERWPLMNVDDVIGAVWSPGDGRVSPSDLCAALTKGAKAAGATIYENTAVEGILTRQGKVVGVRTDQGEIRCDAVALCAGLWSRKMAMQAKACAPLWPCEHFYLLTQAMDGVDRHLPTLADHDSHLYLRDESGGLLVGCFEPNAKAISAERLGEDFAFQLLAEDWEHFEPMMENAMRRIPALRQAEVKTLINGPESFTPDGLFMLGETAETSGLFLGTGMNSVGVVNGGGAGHALAHCIVHGRLPLALPETDPKRFADCFNSAEGLSARAPEVLGRAYQVSFPGRQMATARRLRLPPLYEQWRQRRAHFGQFYGWERPLYFNKEKEPGQTFKRPDWFECVGNEVAAAHERVALFDLSTLGKIRVRGADSEKFLNRVCSADLTQPPGRVIYTAMLNPHGGIESDLIALRLDDETYRLYTGTAAIKRDLAWLRRQASGKVELKDETEEWATFCLAGAGTPALATALNLAAINGLRFFTHCQATLAGKPILAARMSHVGEAGWEITCRWQDARAVVDCLLQAGASPAGFYAETSMRIEKGFAAYGRDINADLSPLEARLPVHWDSPFIGKEALTARRQEKERRLVCLVADEALREDDDMLMGDEPVSVGGEIVGQTASAAFGYRLQRQVALALLPTEPLRQNGNRATINLAGQSVAATAFFGAAYDPAAQRIKGAIQ